MNWTTERPTVPGYYVFKHAAYLPLCLVRVYQGKSHLAQDPEWLYASGYASTAHGPLSEVQGKWFGPIPEPE